MNIIYTDPFARIWGLTSPILKYFCRYAASPAASSTKKQQGPGTNVTLLFHLYYYIMILYNKKVFNNDQIFILTCACLRQRWIKNVIYNLSYLWNILLNYLFFNFYSFITKIIVYFKILLFNPKEWKKKKKKKKWIWSEGRKM